MKRRLSGDHASKPSRSCLNLSATSSGNCSGLGLTKAMLSSSGAAAAFTSGVRMGVAVEGMAVMSGWMSVGSGSDVAAGSGGAVGVGSGEMTVGSVRLAVPGLKTLQLWARPSLLRGLASCFVEV